MALKIPVYGTDFLLLRSAQPPDKISDYFSLVTDMFLHFKAQNVEHAKHHPGRTVSVRPDSGHSKYLSMTQLFLRQEGA